MGRSGGAVGAGAGTRPALPTLRPASPRDSGLAHSCWKGATSAAAAARTGPTWPQTRLPRPRAPALPFSSSPPLPLPAARGQGPTCLRRRSPLTAREGRKSRMSAETLGSRSADRTGCEAGGGRPLGSVAPSLPTGPSLLPLFVLWSRIPLFLFVFQTKGGRSVGEADKDRS